MDRRSPTDFVYLPVTQHPQSRMTLVAQSDAEAANLASPLRRVVRDLDPNVPIYDVRTMSDFFNERAIKVPTMIVQTIGTMGLMGLVLAMIGLYGLVAFSVSRRTREIGIRMAIGADRSSVLRMVLKQGLLLAVCGIVIGMIGSLGADRIVRFVFNGTKTDAAAFAIMVAVQLAVTLLATYAPARRASLVDPMRALREE